MPYTQPVKVTENACFFYGTLMSPKILYRVIYGTVDPEPWQCEGLRVRPAILRGYCRHQVLHADYPGITADEGKFVKGTYVAGLNSGDMHRLDVFEGCQYDRRMVKVALLDESGKEVEEAECFAYVFDDEEGMLKDEWSFEEFVRDKMHRWTGEPSEYSDVDSDDPLGEEISTPLSRLTGGGFKPTV